MKLKFNKEEIEAIQWQGNNFSQVVDFLKYTLISAENLSNGVIFVGDTHVDTGFYIVIIDENKVCFLSRAFVDNFCDKTDIFEPLRRSGLLFEVTSPNTAVLDYQQHFGIIAGILENNKIEKYSLRVDNKRLYLTID